MGIAELHDAIAVEGFRQVCRGVLKLTDFQCRETYEIAVEHQSPSQQRTHYSSFSPMTAWSEPTAQQ